MSTILSDLKRRMIPRWRGYRSTVLTGELDSNSGPAPLQTIHEDEINLRITAWGEIPSIATASDLVSTALVLGEPDMAKSAAEFLLREDTSATEAIKQISRLIIGEGEKDMSNTQASSEPLGRETIFAKIHLCKTELTNQPRNSLLMVDLSRLYTLLGQEKQALRAMKSAIALAPSNRFVLRSATRLMLHLDDPEQAHSLLSSTPRTKQDPWLLAAEIAVSTVIGKSSRNVKSGLRILTAKSHSPFHSSELAGSLGTLELLNGSNRIGKKLFNISLENPTDNAVAQAVWASSQVTSLEIQESLFDHPWTYEANARKNQMDKNWTECAENCALWLNDELFSSQPAILGSFASAVGLDNNPRSEQFCRTGLLANPTDFILRNNLIVSLARQGKVAEARDELRKLDKSSLGLRNQCVAIATEGLVNFREGRPVQGRDLYQRSIDKALSSSLFSLGATASIYWAIEESRVGEPLATSTRELARELVARSGDSETKWLFGKIPAN